MKYLILIIVIHFMLSCSGNTEKKKFKKGFNIEHSKVHFTTFESFKEFDLHTWTNDTFYRHCGYEIEIIPKDSLDTIKLNARGARLVSNWKDPNKYIVEAIDSIVYLYFSTSDSTITRKFVSPELPNPKLNKRSVHDSLILSLEQPNKRLKSLFPYDCRYSFIYEGENYERLKLHKDEFDLSNLNIIRLNYRDKSFIINTK